jgi:hypothetical protein
MVLSGKEATSHHGRSHPRRPHQPGSMAKEAPEGESKDDDGRFEITRMAMTEEPGCTPSLRSGCEVRHNQHLRLREESEEGVPDRGSSGGRRSVRSCGVEGDDTPRSPNPMGKSGDEEEDLVLQMDGRCGSHH